MQMDLNQPKIIQSTDPVSASPEVWTHVLMSAAFNFPVLDYKYYFCLIQAEEGQRA